MAVTTENSDQIDNGEASPPVMEGAHTLHGKVRLAYFDFTQGSSAGDAGSLAYLVKLPAGTVRVLNPLSFIGFSAMGAARTMDLGWLAYTDQDGDAVAADPNGLDDGIDVSSAGTVVPGGTVGGGETYVFQSNSGVTLTAQINDDTIPAAATLNGFIAYVVD